MPLMKGKPGTDAIIFRKKRGSFHAHSSKMAEAKQRYRGKQQIFHEKNDGNQKDGVSSKT
jgi:hypothetical protein